MTAEKFFDDGAKAMAKSIRETEKASQDSLEGKKLP